MSNPTRRSFLKVAGAGAGGAAAVAVLPASVGHHETKTPWSATLPTQAKGALMAYVTDVSSGEVAVMVEGHEVTVTDPALVARLAQVLHSAPSSPAAQA